MQAEHAADEDLLVEVRPGKAMIFRGDVRRQLLPRQAQRKMRSLGQVACRASESIWAGAYVRAGGTKRGSQAAPEEATRMLSVALAGSWALRVIIGGRLCGRSCGCAAGSRSCVERVLAVVGDGGVRGPRAVAQPAGVEDLDL